MNHTLHPGLAASNGGNIWAIGDVQGCLPSLEQLLAHPEIATDPDTRFWFAGDLINRGPDSLGSLRRIMALGDRATVVLGNHDLHLLGVVAGLRDYGKSDTFADILQAPDADELIHWLRHRPLAHYENGYLLVHAGVLPAWNLATALELAHEAETALRAPDWATQIHKMYGNKPAAWDPSLSPAKRLRYIVNVFTRMRLCNAHGDLLLGKKQCASHAGAELPWFDVPARAIKDEATIIFGHWSVLGLMLRPDAICLDTGCVWGRQLSALRLHDQRLVQVNCPPYRTPSGA